MRDRTRIPRHADFHVPARMQKVGAINLAGEPPQSTLHPADARLGVTPLARCPVECLACCTHRSISGSRLSQGHKQATVSSEMNTQASVGPGLAVQMPYPPPWASSIAFWPVKLGPAAHRMLEKYGVPFWITTPAPPGMTQRSTGFVALNSTKEE